MRWTYLRHNKDATDMANVFKQHDLPGKSRRWRPRRKARNEGSYPTQAAIILHGSQAVSRLVLIAVTTQAVPGQKESNSLVVLEAGEELTISSNIFQSRNLILWSQEALQRTSSSIKLFQEAKNGVSHSDEVFQLVPPQARRTVGNCCPLQAALHIAKLPHLEQEWCLHPTLILQPFPVQVPLCCAPMPSAGVHTAQCSQSSCQLSKAGQEL